ncbi:MAG: Uncharacterized protein FD162_882 [Rhodobacteraceae bacterium]|uniref:hypothetical protein n=1 Tax=Cypionkella sp. TaxID=2811411 RepID=UPI001324A069|nr:hypothetical protein [Cypionkella sp.]KAF0174795.1 MAG: Uncharacterized protein FD162_882 [Paracoccaceae bacterium]MDO8328016.1 hypothetical protein [Cypionkella sp.]
MIPLALLCCAILYHGLRQPAGYVRLPVLHAGLFAAWVLPQLNTVLADDLLPQSGRTGLALMSFLCLASSWLGWYAAPAPRHPRPAPVGQMTIPVLALTALSVALNLRVSTMALDMVDVSQWSGPITIVAFFASIRYLALALSLIVFLRQPSLLFGLLLLANLGIAVPLALVGLRRTEIMGFLATIMCGLWLGRRIRIPLGLLAAAAMAFAVVVYVIGPLRGASAAIELETGQRPSLFSPVLWQRIDVKAEMERGIGDAPDLLNATYIIALRADSGGLGLGAGTWNRFVTQYVPGQIVGAEVKQSLFLASGVGKNGNNTGIYDEIEGRFGFSFQLGTTQTGIGSAYDDFGLLGAGYFFLISHLMRRLYNAGLAGDVWAQALYVGQVALSLVSVTHHHTSLLVTMPLLFGAAWVGRRLGRLRLGTAGRRLQVRP